MLKDQLFELCLPKTSGLTSLQSRLKIKIARLVWQLATLHLAANKTTVAAPANFLTYNSTEHLCTSDLVENLISTYQEVFRRSLAWQEEHPAHTIHRRLVHELAPPAAIAVMLGDSEQVIAGFCWGQVLTASQIVTATMSAPSFTHVTEAEWQNLCCRLNKLMGPKKALFVHEIGVLKKFRGLVPLQFLYRSVLRMGHEAGVKSVVWWTSPRSHAYRLSMMLGLEPIAEVGGLIFFFSPNFIPVLKATSHFDTNRISRIVKMASRFGGMHR